jgi:P27 family predicted phage terminase small subunit
MAENLPTRPRQGEQGTATAEGPPTAPPHLSEEAGAMWRSIVEGWVLGADALPLLRAACEQWDSYQAARAVLAAQGPTVATGDGGMVRVHPAAAVAKDALREFRMCFRQLGLEPPTAPDGGWYVK